MIHLNLILYTGVFLVLTLGLMSTNRDFCSDPNSVREQIAELCRVNIKFVSTAVKHSDAKSL